MKNRTYHREQMRKLGGVTKKNRDWRSARLNPEQTSLANHPRTQEFKEKLARQRKSHQRGL